MRLEQRDETLEVIAHVRLRVGERVAHARLRREVRDVREAVLHEQAAEQLGVADVALQHLVKVRVRAGVRVRVSVRVRVRIGVGSPSSTSTPHFRRCAARARLRAVE